MGRLVDTDDLERALCKFMERNNIMSHYSTVFDAIDFETLIDEAPTIDAAPVMRGHWVIDPASVRAVGRSNGKRCIRATCSECKTLGSPTWKCCPVCTANMEESNANE